MGEPQSQGDKYEPASESTSEGDQTVSDLLPEDRERLQEQRAVVEAYLADPEEKAKYATAGGKRDLLQTLLANKVFGPDETYKLQCMGIVFGDAFVQELGVQWVMVEDKYGRDPALRLEGTSILLFPLTMISKRIEPGEDVDVSGLFGEVADWVAEKKEEELLSKKAAQFWEWFQSNEDRFRHVEGPDKEALLDEILANLHQYCEGLAFEVGGHPEGPRELIISADGDRARFGQVDTLVTLAPVVEGWEFVAFKPAMGFEFVTEYKDVRLDPREMWFLPLKSKVNPNSLGLRLTGPTYDKASHEAYLHACYLVLDCGLGEVAAAQEIQHVEAVAMPEEPAAEGFIELVDLPDYIGWNKKQEHK